MKKEFLDHLYGQRFALKCDLDELVDKMKLPQDDACKNCGDPDKARLEAMRDHLLSVNQSIDGYLKVHK